MQASSHLVPLLLQASSHLVPYLRAYQRWRVWTGRHSEISVYPIKDAHFALYLQHLAETSKSRATVEEMVNAVAWVQQLADHQPVSPSPFSKVRKEPVTVGMLRDMVDNLGLSPKLSDIRLVAVALLAFSAFLCFDELSKLRCCDLSFADAVLSVHVSSSKTDQFRQGDTVVIARTGNITCPVAMLDKYLAAAEISLSSDLLLFRGVVHTSKGERLRPSGGLSYTRMRELFLAELSQL